MPSSLARRALGAALLAVSLVVPAHAAASPGARVLPPQASPYGQTYGEWAVRWWQWAVTQPTPVNPVLDSTGAHCAQGQQGFVWFLAGTFSSGTPITRRCAVPRAHPVLFPVINEAYFAFLNDPPEQRTEAFVRSIVAPVAGAEDLTASVDGLPVDDVSRYYEESPLFRVVLPTDNILGIEEGTGPGQAPGLVMDPSVDAGYYLMTTPLEPGLHTIHFSGRVPASGFAIDVTYLLDVA